MTLLAIAGFSPVPFKLLTITSGFVHFNFLYFIIISFLTRGLRFFIIAFLMEIWASIHKFMKRHGSVVHYIGVVLVFIFAFVIYFLNIHLRKW